jgi:hypothetical protein
MTNLGKVKIIDICPECEQLIRETLGIQHFYIYKIICTTFSNGNISAYSERHYYIPYIFELENLLYVSTIDNNLDQFLVHPNGKFDINDIKDGYCINSGHKFR